MTKAPVHAPGIQPGLEKHPRFRKSITAARTRVAAVPAGKTLIDQISDADWHGPDDGLDMTVGRSAAAAQ
tara:strand:+ start:533 stop:742 length:210 start_codon:yes stop_codon:yes gene_type:complete